MSCSWCQRYIEKFTTSSAPSSTVKKPAPTMSEKEEAQFVGGGGRMAISSRSKWGWLHGHPLRQQCGGS
jgi:hypothetical protein